MRILITDKLASEGLSWLENQPGVEVSIRTGLTEAALPGALAEHDGAVIRSSVTLSGSVLEAACGNGSRFRAVARAGVGTDNVDLPTATRLGIAVMNSASASTITTAEHAFALLIAWARNIAPAAAAMAGGGWDRNRFLGRQLYGRTLGVVGFGRIGRTMAQRGLAFGMNVVAFDPMVNAESALDGQVRLVSSFHELLGEVDFLSFHVPKTDQTAGMLDAAAFEAARAGLVVVNAARGGIIVESALLEAIESGRCAGAALDVYETEPPPANSPLRNHPRILLSPHLGASTTEAQEAVAVEACRALVTYLRGEGLIGAVNSGGLELDLSDRQQAFADLARRMVALLGATPASSARLKSVRFTLRGDEVASRADTIARYGLVEILTRHLDEPVNLINAAIIAGQRHLTAETIIAADHGDDRLSIELCCEDATRRVEGAIFADGLPRVTHLDGYAMDMVPTGHLLVLTNQDEPGRIGVVGAIFGDAAVNIAEMVIGRRADAATGRTVAMMILKLDDAPTDALMSRLREAPGILSVEAVELGDIDFR